MPPEFGQNGRLIFLGLNARISENSPNLAKMCLAYILWNVPEIVILIRALRAKRKTKLLGCNARIFGPKLPEFCWNIAGIFTMKCARKYQSVICFGHFLISIFRHLSREFRQARGPVERRAKRAKLTEFSWNTAGIIFIMKCARNRHSVSRTCF